jgi:glycosyltransferase involved in cell wall biosynthesis
MRVALVHYWLVNWRGGERVLKSLADIFPGADIFTHVARRELIERELPGRNIRTTLVSRLPFAQRLYQRYLPLMPLALERLDMQSYDLVISSESGPAKGVIVAPHALHVCYCHSPMRYLWDQSPEYERQAGPLTRALMGPVFHYVRMWDQVSSQRVDYFVANSRFIAQRIAKYYRRASEVIHPPVAVDAFDSSRPSEDFYLAVGQLVRYKRPDLLVEAFNRLGKPLRVIGDGEMLPALRRVAHPNVHLLGSQPFSIVRDLYARCRALIFPGIEDFGIVPVEAMASGKPVIAFGRGGVLDTVIDGVTGFLFHEQSVDALVQAVRDFEERRGSFDSAVIRAHAMSFSEQRFKSQFTSYIAKILGSTGSETAPG